MRTITLDEYYLSEQDEPTVAVQLAVLRARTAGAASPGADAVIWAPSAPRPSLRRRLRVLYRAAGVALIA